jgi:hypothetical protein
MGTPDIKHNFVFQYSVKEASTMQVGLVFVVSLLLMISDQVVLGRVAQLLQTWFGSEVI